MKFYIGTTNFKYTNEVWWPENIKIKNLPVYYSLLYNSVEIQESITILRAQNWYRLTPKSFRFNVRIIINHINKFNHNVFLKWLQLFENKLNCFVLQFDSNYDEKNIVFIKNLTKYIPKKVKCVFEFTKDIWYNETVYDILRDNNWSITFTYYSKMNIDDKLDVGFYPKLSNKNITANYVYITMLEIKKTYNSNILEKIKLFLDNSKLKTCHFYFNYDSNSITNSKNFLKIINNEKMLTNYPINTGYLLYTIGHSTRSMDEFIGLLINNGIEEVIDVRSIPKSAHEPQFNMNNLDSELKKHKILYKHMGGLGGFRRAKLDSVNTMWKNASFRGFADYMLTPEFKSNLDKLIKISKSKIIVIMCAEAVPWRCHRSLIADALIIRNFLVYDIINTTRKIHKLTSFARISGTNIIYDK